MMRWFMLVVVVALLAAGFTQAFRAHDPQAHDLMCQTALAVDHQRLGGTEEAT